MPGDDKHCEACDADDNKPTTELVRGDLARWVHEKVAPAALEQVNENILREVKQERDSKWHGKATYWLAEVEPGVWETTSTLPHGVPTLRVYAPNPLRAGNGVHWQYAKALFRMRVCRDWEKALEWARETEFRTVGLVKV